MRRQLGPGSQTFDVASAVDGLRHLISKTEAFATMADDLFEDVRTVHDSRQQERVAWLVTEASVAGRAALAAVTKLIRDLVEHRGKLRDEEHANTWNDGSTPSESRRPSRRRADRAREGA
jgi:hypothetical protein